MTKCVYVFMDYTNVFDFQVFDDEQKAIDFRNKYVATEVFSSGKEISQVLDNSEILKREVL